MTSPDDLAAARGGDERAFERLVRPFRRELQAHCYRMSGSLHDSEDLLQESLLRAWKGLAAFEGRSSVRTWLYKIATNVCLNALEAKKPRTTPMDAGPPGDPDSPMSPRLEPMWIEPCPRELYTTGVPTPEARYDERESVALAFMAALQLLPASQRAALILHDVLGWRAGECADLLDTTVAAVNSALQRARETLATRADAWQSEARPPEEERDVAPLLARYIRAWEKADLPALVSLLHEDATLAMPPIPTWLRGAAALEASMRAMVFASCAPGDFRLVVTEANGSAALAVYRRDPVSLEHRPYALQIVDWASGRVRGLTAFLDTSLFEPFGLPRTAP